MKIIIAGVGKVGATLTQQLSVDDYDMTLIDSRGDVLEECMQSFDVMGVQGNCAIMGTLREAGIDETDLLIAATDADEENLLCCMTAHSMNPNIRTIARIRNPEYSEQMTSMGEMFALSLTVNPDRQAAREIARLIKYPGFLKRDTFVRGLVEIVELKIQSGDLLDGVALSELVNKVRCQILICAVLRGGECIIPSGNAVLRAGDRVFVTASSDNITTLLHSLGIITRKAKRVLIAGGGRISVYLAQYLKKANVRVQIIEQDEKRCRDLASIIPDASIVCSDASEHAVLVREGLEAADVFVTLTGMDETNMLLSMYAAQKKVPQVITKIGRSENYKLSDSLPLGSIVCPKDLACNTIVQFVRAADNPLQAATTMHTIADGQAEAIEFTVDNSTLHRGEKLRDFEIRKNVLIAMIARMDTIIFPKGDSSFETGDMVIIVTTADTMVRQLNDIFV